MELGILTQYYPPEMGAPQARLSALATAFVKRGHKVTVLTAMPNYPLGRILVGYRGVFHREILNEVDVHRCWMYANNSVRKLPRLASYGSFVSSSAVLGAFTLNHLDYLLTESPPLFLGISGYFLSRLKRARWIFNISDLWPESALRLGVIENGTALKFAAKLEAWCYRKAWLVSGQSVGILAHIGSRFPDVTTYHLSNGVDTRVFSPHTKKREFRETFGDPDECIVMYAGLHGIAQGLGQVLEAARRIDGQLRIRFVFIGDGPEKGALIARARDLGLTNVRFLEPIPHRDIPAALNAADIAVVPLRLDLPGAVPSKLYEAMAAGLPVIVIAEGEPAEIVREAEAGFVVRPGDINALETAIRQLESNSSNRTNYGANGRRVAVERYDRKQIVAAFISYLEARLDEAHA